MIYILLSLLLSGCSLQTVSLHGPVSTDSQGDHYANSRLVIMVEIPDVRCEGSCLKGK